jgi:hypothetical protein
LGRGVQHSRQRSTARRPAGPDAGCRAADVFDALWAALADVIGPTATAALVQRSVKRAAASEPELQHLLISREQFIYKYSLPASWGDAEADARPALRQVVRELVPLLAELTGPVVVRRLRQDPLLRRCGVIPQDADQ